MPDWPAGILLIANWYWRVQPTVDSTIMPHTPRQVGLDYIIKGGEHEPGSEPVSSIPPQTLLQFLPSASHQSSCPGWPRWLWFVRCKCFHPQVVFGHGVYLQQQDSKQGQTAELTSNHGKRKTPQWQAWLQERKLCGHETGLSGMPKWTMRNQHKSEQAQEHQDISCTWYQNVFLCMAQ